MAAQDVFSATNGVWTALSAWSAGSTPTASADAFIGNGASGAASASSFLNVVVNSLAVNSRSALTIDFGSTFTATDGSVLSPSDSAFLGVGNAGVIKVENNSTLRLGDAFFNSGAIDIGASSLADFGTLNLIGVVTLIGGGTVNLGAQQGAAGTLGDVTGNGLVNAGNTIAGAGTFALNTLDNQTGGVILADQQFSDDLIFDVAHMSNEGQFQIASYAGLQLGEDGQTLAMTNAGRIEIGFEGGTAGAGAELLIAGDFTVSGPGALDLMGQNAGIASDGSPSAFVNAGAILATQTSQIGDANLGYDDLTFINSGTTTATGAGVVLTLDTGGVTIGDGGVLEALAGATLAINSAVNLSGASAAVAGQIVAGAGGTVDLSANVGNSAYASSIAGGAIVDAGGVLNILSSVVAAPVTVYGASGATAGGVVNTQSGGSVTGPVAFATAGAALNLVDQTTPTTVNGAGGQITLSSAAVVVNGGGNVISVVGGAGNAATVAGNFGGQADLFNGSFSTVSLLANALLNVTGGGDIVTAAAGSVLVVNGAGNTVLAVNDTVTLGGNFGGAANIVTGSGAEIAILPSAVATVNSANDVIVAAAGAVVSVTGAGDTIQESAATLTLGANTGAADVVNGSSAHLSLLASALATVNGDDDAIVAAAGAAFTVNGAGDTVQASHDTITFGGDPGVDDAVIGSFDSLTLLAGADVVVSGSDDSIFAASGALFSITGNGNTIQAADDILSVGNGSGAANVVNATSATISLTAGSHTYVNGGGDTVAFAAGAKSILNLTGGGDNVQAAGEKIYLSGMNGVADAVTGAGNRIIAVAGASLDVVGANNYVHLGAGASVGVTGINERLVGAGFTVAPTDGADFWIGGTGLAGAADVVNGSNCTIRVGGAANIQVSGDDDTVSVYGYSQVALHGAGLLAHVGHGVALAVGGNGAGGVVDTLTGAFFSATVTSSSNVEIGAYDATATLGDNDVVAVERANNAITAGASDTISILWGASNQVVLGTADVVTDGGTGSLFKVGGNVGATAIGNFGADTLGVIDLLNGVGGYATAAAAYAALTGDGAGGLALSLGAQGSIDFTGPTASLLTAANFKIG